MGGAQYQAKFIVNALLKSERYNIHYLSRRTLDAVTDGSHRVYNIRGPRFLSNYTDTFDALELWRTLNRIKPDIIYHRTGSGHTGICAAYAQKKNIPIVWHVASEMEVTPAPELNWSQHPHKMLEKKVLEYGVRKMTRIVVQTDTQKDLLKKHYGIEADLVLPNFHPAPSEKISKTSRCQVLWIANAKLNKQPKLFMDLASDLRHHSDVDFVMMGSPPDEKAEREHFFSKIDALPNLTYLGKVPQEQVNARLATGHLLINTSGYEGLSNTFIQAWMRGVPVISLNSNPDNLLTSGKMGECVEGSYSLLKSTVNKYINDDVLRNAVGRESMRVAAITYSMDNVSRLVNLIDRLG